MPTPKPKPVGRPKLHKDHAKSSIVPVRFSGTDRKRVEDAAREDGQSVSEWTRSVLARATKQQRFSPKECQGYVVSAFLYGRFLGEDEWHIVSYKNRGMTSKPNSYWVLGDEFRLAPKDSLAADMEAMNVARPNNEEREAILAAIAEWRRPPQ